VYKRETWLGRLTENRELLAVAGTHGKTTTSSMLSIVLRDAFGDDLAAVVGADVPQYPDCGGALHGASKRFVLEADEYDGAFLSVRNPPHASRLPPPRVCSFSLSLLPHNNHGTAEVGR
jgi:UDP-N-acetylmuramate-alanine ligase